MSLRTAVRATLLCLGLFATLASQVNAQLVTYQFTGTKIYGYGDVGTTISGTVTLDVGAASTYYYPYDYGYDDGSYGYHSRGFNEQWYNGGFSINGVTDSGFAQGTAFGGDTYFYQYSDIYDRWDYYGAYHYESSASYIYQSSYDGTHSRGIYVYGRDNLAGSVTPGRVPNPWDPAGNDYSTIYIYDYNYSTGVYEYAEFSIDSFTAVPTTIVIDGVDTRIDDFQYQGKLVSKHLDDCAAAARNHGDYVSCVAKLTNALVKAGLLTGKQKGIIMDAAAMSSYGK